MVAFDSAHGGVAHGLRRAGGSSAGPNRGCGVVHARGAEFADPDKFSGGVGGRFGKAFKGPGPVAGARRK